MAKKKKRSRRRSNSFGSVTKMFTPTIIAAVTEPFVDQLASQIPIPTIGGIQSDDLVKVAAGYLLGKKSGVVGQTARMYGIFGLRNIVKQFVGTGLSGLGAAPSQQIEVLY